MKIKIKLSELLYFLAFFIWLFANFFVQTSFVNKYPNLYRFRILAMIICMVVLFGKLMVEKITSKTFLYICSMMGLAIIIGISTHKLFDALSVISTIMLIVSTKNVRFKSIMIFWLMLIALFMATTFLSWKMGLIENVLRFQLGRGIRFGLGYQYPTFGANYFFHFTIFYLYIRKNKVTILESILLAGINYYFYINSDTKSAFYLAIITLILVYLLKNINIDQRTLRFTRRFMLSVGVLTPILLTYFYNPNNEIFRRLNWALTGRLSLGKQAISNFGVHLFGQQINWELQQRSTSVFDDYMYVDSSFVNILLHYGIILLIVICFSYYKVFSNKKFDTIETIVIVILILHSMFDPQFFEMMYNPMLLLLGFAWIGEEDLKEV